MLNFQSLKARVLHQMTTVIQRLHRTAEYTQQAHVVLLIMNTFMYQTVTVH